MEALMDKEFENVMKAHVNIWDFLWEEPRLAWDGGYIPVMGSMFAAFHISRRHLWPRLLNVIANTKNGRPMQQVQSPFHKPIPKEPTIRPMPSPMQMAFELSIGFWVGYGVNYMTMEHSKRTSDQTVVRIPLKAGHSKLCDTLCPVFLEEYRRQWKESKGNRRAMLRNPTYHELQVTLQFVQNCRHRQLMEQRLRRDLGLPDSSPVTIPEPGVTISANEDPLPEMMMGHQGEEEESSSESSDPSWSHLNTESWVEDQGETK